MKRLLITMLICLAIVFLVYQYLDNLYIATGIKALFLVCLTLLYNVEVGKKRFFFTLFLIVFTLGEALYFSTWHMEDESWNIFYYVTNFIFILAYISLIAHFIRDLNIREVFTKFPLHLIVLLTMGFFSVHLISASTQYELGANEYYLELVYNAVVMILLSLALLKFIIKDNKKSMNFLVGSILIVFSEMIQYTYFYIVEESILNMVHSVMSIAAFTLFYLAARLQPSDDKEYLMDQKLQKIRTQSLKMESDFGTSKE